MNKKERFCDVDNIVEWRHIITILLALVAMAGQAQTPKDSCSIPKDSLCQERIANSDTVNCPLDKLFLLKANVTNKEESKRNLPWRIAFMMLAAFSLSSCSSDDDVTDNVFN